MLVSLKYHKDLERYLIMRDKHTLGNRHKIKDKERVPYAYLLQLGMKHLENVNSLLTEQGKQKKYEELLRAASAYLEILNLQGHIVFSGVTEIGDYALSNLWYVEEISIVPKLTKVGEKALEGLGSYAEQDTVWNVDLLEK